MADKNRPSAFIEFEGAPMVFDVVLTEVAEHGADVTDHAVEDGANVADHVRERNATITLDILVSNTPVRNVYKGIFDGQVAGLELKVPKLDPPIVPTPGGLMNAGLDALKGVLNKESPAKALVMQFGDKFNACSYVLNSLLDWKERGVVGKAILADRTYSNVLITNVVSKRTSTTGDALEISLSLKTVRIVESKYGSLPIPTEPRGKVAVAKGRQPTTPSTNPQQMQSVFKKATSGRR
jgi:hypothetical protein